MAIVTQGLCVYIVIIYLICLSSSGYFCNGCSAAGLWMGVSEWTVPRASVIAEEPSLLFFLKLSVHCTKMLLLKSGIWIKPLEKGQEYCRQIKYVWDVFKTLAWSKSACCISIIIIWLLPAQLISPFMSCQERPKEAGSALTLGVMHFYSET